MGKSSRRLLLQHVFPTVRLTRLAEILAATLPQIPETVFLTDPGMLLLPVFRTLPQLSLSLSFPQAHLVLLTDLNKIPYPPFRLSLKPSLPQPFSFPPALLMPLKGLVHLLPAPLSQMVLLAALMTWMGPPICLLLPPTLS